VLRVRRRRCMRIPPPTHTYTADAAPTPPTHLGREAALAHAALLRHGVLDDLGLRHEHVHEVAAGHQVKQEVEVVLVLLCGGGGGWTAESSRRGL
jgi:hypothetical protein